MAVTIPIISEFDGKGISKAIAQFQQLETTGEKAQFALKKAALPAAAAMAGLTAAIGLSTKAAMDDVAAQEQLAGVLRRTTGATDAQIAANEQFVSSLSMATAVADDQLRPAMAALANVTGDVKTAQNILTQATDIAAATNTDLSTVVDALSKAYGGNMKGLQALDPSLREAIKAGMGFSDVMAVLADKTGGAATAATQTAAGQMRLLKIRLDETKESIGMAFLPVLERLLPVLQLFATFVQNNTGVIVALIAVLGTLAGAILTANAALSVYRLVTIAATAASAALGTTITVSTVASVGALTAGIALLAGALVVLDQKTQFVRRAFELLGPAINVILGPVGTLVGFLGSLGAIDKIKIPSLPSFTPAPIPAIAGGAAPPAIRSAIPSLPTAPAVTAPSISIPTGGGGGGGGNGGGVSILPTPFANMAPIRDVNWDATLAREAALAAGTINVTVNTVTAPADLGETIVDALRQYNRSNGPVDVLVAS